MYKRPLTYVVAFVLVAILCGIAMPLIVILGYPTLMISAAGLVVRSREGEIERPGQAACLLTMYLGLLMFFHGTLYVMDTPFSSPPSDEARRFGNGLAYLGAGVAGISAISAYALDPSRKGRIR